MGRGSIHQALPRLSEQSGDAREARAAVDEGLKLASEARPTAVYTLEGYAGLAEIALELLPKNRAVAVGKIERWHKSPQGECIRPGTPLSLDDARRLVSGYVDHYNNVGLNSAAGYITPRDMLAGRQQEIHAKRDRKLETARRQRQIRRQHAA